MDMIYLNAFQFDLGEVLIGIFDVVLYLGQSGETLEGAKVDNGVKRIDCFDAFLVHRKSAVKVLKQVEFYFLWFICAICQKLDDERDYLHVYIMNIGSIT